MNWLLPLAGLKAKRKRLYFVKNRKSPITLRNGIPDTSRRVVVGGREYRSMLDACNSLGISTTKLYAMERSGKALIL